MSLNLVIFATRVTKKYKMARQDDNGDWQSRKAIKECNHHMLINQLACDVEFVVGPEQRSIRAHKYVLSSRSCVFFAMFFGPLSGNTGDKVTIPDMTEEQFRSLLDYLYTDEVKITLQNVLPVLYASKKYCVQSLIDKCLNILKRSMRFENVCTVMENAHIFGNDELKEKCFNMILLNPEEVFTESYDLGELCDECFGSIIGDDRLPVSEEVVFKAVMKYGQMKHPYTRETGWIQATDEMIRNSVKNVITKVRFPLMNEQFFSDEVEPKNVLSENQILQVYRYFIKKSDTACPDFNANKRKGQYAAKRFTDIVSGWGYKRDNRDAISFKVSQDIVVRGVIMYGSDQGPAEMDMYIHLKQQPYGTNVAVKRFLIETDGKQKTYKLLFDNPAKLTKDTLYTIEAVIRNGTTYYGSGGLAEVEIEGVKITFEKSPRSTNNTGVERGQIPAIIFEMVQAENGEAMETR